MKNHDKKLDFSIKNHFTLCYFLSRSVPYRTDFLRVSVYSENATFIFNFNKFFIFVNIRVVDMPREHWFIVVDVFDQHPDVFETFVTGGIMKTQSYEKKKFVLLTVPSSRLAFFKFFSQKRGFYSKELILKMKGLA